MDRVTDTVVKPYMSNAGFPKAFSKSPLPNALFQKPFYISPLPIAQPFSISPLPKALFRKPSSKSPFPYVVKICQIWALGEGFCQRAFVGGFWKRAFGMRGFFQMAFRFEGLLEEGLFCEGKWKYIVFFQ